MDRLDELKNRASNVNNLLSKYIDLHNIFLKNTGSIWSIFKKVNFADLSENAYVLFEQLIDEKNSIEKLKDQVNKRKEKEFAESLFRYTKSLAETVHFLFMLLSALKEKAEGVKLSMKKHLENNKSYKQSIEVYMAYGEELNKIYSSL